MKILLTGANGFLGKTIIEKSNKPLSEFITTGRNYKAMIQCDLSVQIPVIPAIDMVIHTAGLAHVNLSSMGEKKLFFDVNVTGTKNLLTALENNPTLKKVVFISSVAVYGLTTGYQVSEDAPLLAKDAYGQSKIAAERLITDWCTAKNIDYYIVRLPLIAGKNAPGNLGAMVKGIKTGRYLSIGKANAQKSMVLANDLALFLPCINGPSGIYNLTDGYHPAFLQLERKIAAFFNRKKIISIPFYFIRILGFAGDLIGSSFPINTIKLNKITSTLTFDDAKARNKLNWKPQEVLKNWTIE